MPLKALICDDEPVALDELRFLLSEAGGVDIAAEASGGAEALQLIAAGTYDVVFLDIQMPGITGIQLAEVLGALDRRPAVVFVTGHAEHAVEAFRLAAADYLLKPVGLPRLRATLDKLEPSGGEQPRIERVAVEKAGNKRLIGVEEIHCVMAEGDYSYVFTAEDRFLSTSSLALLESRLDPGSFFRIHRRFLVNLHRIREVVPMYGGTLLVTLDDTAKTQLPVSRRRAPALKKVLGL
jgi:DNA-binding LytR/AlgR family response regulator